MSERKRLSDQGSGTVLIVAVMMTAGVLIASLLALGRVIVGRHQAGAIADLAALAAAADVTDGGPAACERARQVAAANAGRLTRCQVLGDGSVVVGAGLAGASGLLARITGSARAGPGAVPVEPAMVLLRPIPGPKAANLTIGLVVQLHADPNIALLVRKPPTPP